jgi:hypothetical protein
VSLLDCFEIIVLDAKPKQNDVATTKINNDVFFILSGSLLSVMLSVTLTANVQADLSAVVPLYRIGTVADHRPPKTMERVYPPCALFASCCFLAGLHLLAEAQCCGV